MEKKMLMLLICLVISSINCQLLTLPIKSFKRNNIDLKTDDPKFKKYLSNFFDSYSFATEWGYKGIHTELNVGTPVQPIITDFTQYFPSLSSQTSLIYQQRNNKNYFSESISFKSLSEITEDYDDYEKYVFLSGLGQDEFHLNFLEDSSSQKSTVTTITSNFNINVNYPERKYTKGVNLKELNKGFNFVLGLQKGDNKEENLLQKLKNQGLISSYDFTFEFFKEPKINPDTEDDEIGRILFGKLPHNPKENLRTAKLLIPLDSEIRYFSSLDHIYLEDNNGTQVEMSNSKKEEKVEFVFEQNLIIGSDYASKKIAEEFFDKINKKEGKEICSKKKTVHRIVKEYELPKEYQMFECSPKIKEYKDEFPTLKFYIKDLDFTFEFNFDDLFRDNSGKTYFLVLFHTKPVVSWVFGKIFLKKYQMYFNMEDKTVSYFVENTKTIKANSFSISLNSKSFLIPSGIIMLLSFFMMGVYVGKNLSKGRKQRANELEDDYEYIQNNKATKLNSKNENGEIELK